jgi:hypothetical protein
MKIVEINNNIILKKNNNEEVSLNNNDIVEYTGIYYKTINDIVETVEIETTFIGTIESVKYRNTVGIIGVYIRPLYIWDILNSVWKKINNYKPPMKKNFLYPHLLILPEYNYYYSIKYLHSCKNRSLEDFNNITDIFNL